MMKIVAVEIQIVLYIIAERGTIAKIFSRWNFQKFRAAVSVLFSYIFLASVIFAFLSQVFSQRDACLSMHLGDVSPASSRDSLAASTQENQRNDIAPEQRKACERTLLTLERTHSREDLGENRAQSRRVQPQRRKSRSRRRELPPPFAMIASSQSSCAFRPRGWLSVLSSRLPHIHTPTSLQTLCRVPLDLFIFSLFGVFCFLRLSSPRSRRSRLPSALANSRHRLHNQVASRASFDYFYYPFRRSQFIT